jgi:2,4-dienoyl-CoA reductase-like NADH-dependent reductase (Old Yellow Enzyme family)
MMTDQINGARQRSTSVLFRRFQLKSLKLPNRIVMSPMSRCFTEDGVPSSLYCDYYRRRAEGGTGLLIGEATAIGHPVSCPSPIHTRFSSEKELASWKHIVDTVHSVGGLFMPQIWHAGMLRGPGKEGCMPNPELAPMSPSGWAIPLEQAEGMPGNPIFEAQFLNSPMRQSDIDDVIEAFGIAAADAKAMGSDGVEIHGAHGYLIDQFFWEIMNFRDDRYGGDLVSRTRFAAEVIAECRRRVGADFPIFFRFSQWKQQDYSARLARTPQELEKFLKPLSDAGTDLFDCSTRRFWEPEFPNSDLTLAGWTKKLTGKPSMAVGSVGLQKANWARKEGYQLEDSGIASLEPLIDCMERDEFDLVAVGRSIISNPDLANLLRNGESSKLRPYSNKELYTLE